jgi:hypothetical protein
MACEFNQRLQLSVSSSQDSIICKAEQRWKSNLVVWSLWSLEQARSIGVTGSSNLERTDHSLNRGLSQGFCGESSACGCLERSKSPFQQPPLFASNFHFTPPAIPADLTTPHLPPKFRIFRAPERLKLQSTLTPALCQGKSYFS